MKILDINWKLHQNCDNNVNPWKYTATVYCSCEHVSNFALFLHFLFWINLVQYCCSTRFQQYTFVLQTLGITVSFTAHLYDNAHFFLWYLYRAVFYCLTKTACKILAQWTEGSGLLKKENKHTQQQVQSVTKQSLRQNCDAYTLQYTRITSTGTPIYSTWRKQRLMK